MTKKLLFTKLMASAALAVCVPQVAQAQTSESHEFRIPEQDLDAALTELARQSDEEIYFSSDLTRGKTAPAIVGRLTTGEALRKILSRSNLTYQVTSSGGITIRPKAGSDTNISGSSVASGQVVDQNSGANLKGALVEIEGTDRTTSTDNLGNFRFPGLRPGTYRIRISFLGYQDIHAEMTVGPRAKPAVYKMVGGTPDAQIVVYGRRSARAQALNQERTAENVSTVISGDLLGAFTGTTVSEALRRAPGVVFDRDPQTGEGSNIGVRGLSADLNMVTFNGIELPEGSGTGRSASLGNILTESIGSVTINKTLLPNMDSAGTGGLVEIVTKTPLDRARRYASLTVEGARRGKDFKDDFLAAGTVSAKFGKDDRFGLSASVQYREGSSRRLSYNLQQTYGLYLPVQVDGTTSITSTTGIDPRLAFPFEEGADQVYLNGIATNEAQNDTTNLGITLSAAWDVSDTTQLFFDYQKLDKTSEDYSTNLLVNTSLGYSLRPVEALGGEQRRALGPLIASLPGLIFGASSYNYTPDAKTNTDIYTFRGESHFDALTVKYGAGYTKGTTETESYRLALSSQAEFLNPATAILPEAIDPIEGRIISIFPQRMPGDRSFPDPLLTEAGFDILNNQANQTVFQVNNTLTQGDNTRWNGNLSARYDLYDGWLRYIEVGTSYKSSKFTDATVFNNNYYPVANAALSSFGLSLTNSSLTDVGVATELRQLPRDEAIAFMRSVLPLGVDCPSTAACPPGTPFRIYRAPELADPRLLDEYTKEGELAAYIQGSLQFGRLGVVGGVRMSRVNVTSANLQGPRIYDVNSVNDLEFEEANRVFLEESSLETDFLPRILANYRYNDNLIFRLGYYLSVARPQISLLSKTASATLYQRPTGGPDGNQPTLRVFKGNPDLQPARTHNFDFSAELYDSDAGVIKVGAFYKQINNLLETNFEDGSGVLAQVANILPDDPRFQDVLDNPDDYFIQIALPTNAENDARIWGIETSVERQLTFLPGALGGLGVYANYTFTDSSKVQTVNWSRSPVVDGSGNVTGYEAIKVEVPDVRFNGQARHSGTVGLTYNKYGIDSNIAYTWQDRRQTNFGSFNLSDYEEAYGTLDMRVEYRFKWRPANVRLYLEGTDLLRGPSDSALLGTQGADDGTTPKYYTSATYFGGREVRVGLSVNF